MNRLLLLQKLQIPYAVHLSSMKFCIVDMLQIFQLLHTQGPTVTPKIATPLLEFAYLACGVLLKYS